MESDLTVLVVTAGLSTLYSLWLSKIQHLYSPDYIWLTVVGGNALIGGMLAWWLWLVPLPPWEHNPLAAFWRLFALNVAAGVPVISWQIGQAAGRAQQRVPRPRDRT